VSETVSRGRRAGQQAAAPEAAGQQAAGQQADAVADDGARPARRRRRGGWAAAVLVVVLAAGAVAAWRARVFSPAAPAEAGLGAPAPATATVVREDLSAVMPVPATLGYAGSYTVTGQGGGVLTSLPSPGQVIRQGQALYTTDLTTPVVLLQGTVPDWRALGEGLTGADVSQLNHDLVALGDADSAGIAAAGWDYYSPQTVYGVQQLEKHLGVSSPPGGLPLGSVVFGPQALRVTQVTGSLGGPASGPVLSATSDQQVVMIALDVSDEGEVRAGDAVTVTLPDGSTTPGVVSSVGTVASTSGPGQGSSGSGPGTTTIPVTVTLPDPGAAGGLDQAPVTVNITTASARDVLAVPVAALVAVSPGGYEVEVVGPGNTRRYVRVRVGPVFDGADGVVQVSGALTPGQRVVTAPGS
jgi:hypothetical protein